MKEQLAQQAAQPNIPSLGAYGMMSIGVETLTALVKRRDFLQQQLDTCEKALDPYMGNHNFPEEAFATLQALMETQAAPFREQLKEVETQISDVQKYLEQAAATGTEVTHG